MLMRETPEWAREWDQREWAKGLAKGKEEGMVHEKTLLLRQITHRFGSGAAQNVQDIITPLSCIETLELIGDWIVDCDDEEAFLKAMSALAAAITVTKG